MFYDGDKTVHEDDGSYYFENSDKSDHYKVPRNRITTLQREMCFDDMNRYLTIENKNYDNPIKMKKMFEQVLKQRINIVIQPDEFTIDDKAFAFAIQYVNSGRVQGSKSLARIT